MSSSVVPVKGSKAAAEGPWLQIDSDRWSYVARAIEGDFPNYEQLIPSGYPNRLVVNRASLIEALDRVQIVGQNRDNAAVRLTMSASGMMKSTSENVMAGPR